jgi:two-component system cell cycle sensor histidine kinase/response regulator CckA
VRILVVDDHAQNRYYLERLLAAGGHECVGAANGQVALDTLRNGKFDVIISDVLMPEMDGFQLCRETRRDLQLRETPFIFYTATYTDAADREFGLALGATAYVVKPAEPDEILGAVNGATSVPPGRELVESDTEFYQVYNPRLVQKLEQKVLEIEEAQRALLRSNDALREEVARRNEAEAAVRESLALFEATIASTADGILACDLHGKVIAINAQFSSGWRMAGKDAPSTFGELKAQLREKVTDATAFDAVMVLGDQVESAATVITLEDGGELDTRRRPLLVAGRVVGQVWSCTDTTARRHAELRELELQRRLWDTQKLTDLGLLAAGIAHDFNNLLTIVRGSVETAQMMLGSEHPVHGVLEDVVMCSETGATLVAQILEFSRREKQAPLPQNLGRLVKGSMRLLKLMAPKTVELHLQLEDSQAHVITHSAQLTQVLLNLGVNAIQAMNGRGRITVGVGPVTEVAKAQAEGRTGEFVELSVADSGVGIANANSHKLFEPFYTTKTGQGTGLGLATVHQIVADLGGWIVVESELHRGTVFRVVLPRVSASNDVPLHVGTSGASGMYPAIGAAPEKLPVWIVEPLAEERERLASCVRRVGYEVHAFADASVAFEAMANGQSECGVAVIGELGSPEAAVEVARVFRALSPRVALILTSFGDYSHFTSLTESSSRCAVLSRPYQPETVSQLLGALTASRGAR